MALGVRQRARTREGQLPASLPGSLPKRSLAKVVVCQGCAGSRGPTCSRRMADVFPLVASGQRTSIRQSLFQLLGLLVSLGMALIGGSLVGEWGAGQTSTPAALFTLFILVSTGTFFSLGVSCDLGRESDAGPRPAPLQGA